MRVTSRPIQGRTAIEGQLGDATIVDKKVPSFLLGEPTFGLTP